MRPVLTLVLSLAVSACGPRDGGPGTRPPDTQVDSPATPPLFVTEPTLRNPDNPALRLVQILEVRTDRPVTVRVTLSADHGTRTVEHEERGSTLALPVVGLRAETTYTLEIVATDDDGLQVSATLQTTTGALPDPFPDIQILAHDPARVAVGHTLLDTRSKLGDHNLLMILDEALEPIWIYMGYWRDARMTDEGHILGIVDDGEVLEVDLAGQVWGHWVGEGVGGGLEVPVPSFSHEVFPVDDGFWSLSFANTRVDAFPGSYVDPFSLDAGVEINDPVVVHVSWAGEVLDAWRLASRLDTQRIGFDSLNPTQFGPDWAHANAVVVDPADGGVLVSLRHQDAVVKLDATGELQWILGNHEGWQPSFQPFLLTPVGGDFAWPYHQHAPELTPSGDLVLFDNGNVRETPYGAPAADPTSYSRVVSYRVDPVAMTIEQLWSYRDTPSGDLVATAVGDADLLDNGNVLADFGLVVSEGGVANRNLGLAFRSARIIEFEPSDPDPPALDIRLSAPDGDPTDGWRTFRAERIPPIY